MMYIDNAKFQLQLQLFAENTQTTLSEGLSDEMKTFYEKRLIELAEPNLVYDQLGDKYPIPKNGGKTIEMRKFSPLPKAMDALTEGVTPDGQDLNVTAITATVDEYGAYVTHSDMLQMTAIDNVVVQTTKLLAAQAGRTLDSVVRDVVTGGTNVMYAPKADGTEVLSRATVAADCLLTPEMIFKAVARLRSMNAAPQGDTFVAVVHPNVAADLMMSDKWLDWHKYATPENIYRGEIGQIAGVRFVQSTEAKIFGGAGADDVSVYATMIIGAGAYGVTEIEGGGLQHYVKPLGSAGAADPLNQRASIGWKATKVAERLVEEYMVRIEHASKVGAMAASN